MIQKNKVIDNLDQLNKNEKFVLSYIKWFYELKKELQENYSIKLEEEISSFCRLIIDFKEKGYDAHQIIKEYQRSLSIKLEIEGCEADIARLSNQRASLNNSVLALQSQISMHKQTLEVYSRLQAMSFGLKELNQLWLAILEIAGENNISTSDAVSKFLNYVEEQYNNKLGFEIKIQEKKNDLYNLKNQLNVDRLALQLQPYIGTSLQNLFQNGVSEEDIINVNCLVTKFSKNNNASFPLNTEKSNKDYNLNFKDNDRTNHWKSFIYNIEKLKDIQLEIKEQTESRNKLQKELEDIDKQKQDATTYLQIAISFIHSINHRISYLRGIIDYFDNDLEKKVNNSYMPSKYFHLLLVLIIYDNIQREEKDDATKNI